MRKRLMTTLPLKIFDLYYNHKRYFFAFVSVGILTAIIYFCLFIIFNVFFHINQLISVTIAYFITTFFHFYASKNFTFQITQRSNLQHLLKYLTLLLINYIVTLLVLKITSFFINTSYFRLLYAIGVTTITGYLISKYWVFVNKDHEYLGEKN